MSSGVAVYPSIAAVPLGNMISNTVENVGFSIYSSEDEDDEDPFTTSRGASDAASKIIAEAQSLLVQGALSEDESVECRSPRLSSPRSPTRSSDANHNGREAGVAIGGPMSVNSKRRMKKFVTFNMELNETFEYDRSQARPMETDTEDDGKFSEQVMDAGDLFDSSESEAEDEDEESHAINSHSEKVRVAFGGAEVLTLPKEDERDTEMAVAGFLKDSVQGLRKEKSRLEEEIKLLREEYDTELKRLREEYESRREDYLTELEGYRNDLDLNGRPSDEEIMDGVIDNADMRMRRGQLEEEKNQLAVLEDDLQRRKKQCGEQEQELNEYESYLDRRHKSLTDKEEDLRVLQEELEELARALRRREKDLRLKEEKLNSEDADSQHQRLSPQHENEFHELKCRVEDLTNELTHQKEKAQGRENERKAMEDKLQAVESENKKLQQKVKHLETQLTVGMRLHEPRQDSHYLRRTSVLLARQSSSEGGEVPSPQLLHRTSSGRSVHSGKYANSYSMNSEKKIENSKGNEGIMRIDSRTNISKTCMLM